MWKPSISVVLITGTVAFLLSEIKPSRSGAALTQEQDEVALEAKGYLVPIAQVQVTPRVSGQVTELFIEEGMRVEKDAVLARIDPTPYELDYQRARALVAAARARFEEVRAGAELKKGPRNEHLEALRAELAAAEAAAAKAKWLLDGTQVRAPISGTILDKSAEKGEVINPTSFSLKCKLCVMADLTRMEVEVTLQERDFPKVYKGQKCKIQLEAIPGTIYKGEVSRLRPVADRAKGAIPIRVRIDLPKDAPQLRPDMGALVSFLGKSA